MASLGWLPLAGFPWLASNAWFNSDGTIRALAFGLRVISGVGSFSGFGFDAADR
jgi:hypothetical protein